MNFPVVTGGIMICFKDIDELLKEKGKQKTERKESEKKIDNNIFKGGYIYTTGNYKPIHTKILYCTILLL